MSYVAPVAEQLFALQTSGALESVVAACGLDPSVVALAGPILVESGKLAAAAFAPLDRAGDLEGAHWSDGRVTVPAGFAEAYAQYAAGGWSALAASPDHGGQGLPFVLALAVQEQFTAANLALSLCTMLGQGAIAALDAHGSSALRDLYLGKLVSGEWAGTMNLTEPQAGSDVGALRTRADRSVDGSYRIKGGKIFITFGEHDMTDNIVHLVLARLPDAPPGTKGISLFLVPKILPDGSDNDVRCVAIEHKMGIHGSPTCTMSFGDADRCVGWLIGAEHDGMRAMFTMMNHARINVGLQGVAIAERATQASVAFARERVQGKRLVEHPDVRRMLMTMRATTQAIRATTYANAALLDRAHATGDEATQALADLLTPITKAFSTDMGVEVASLAIQVHGGMGFVEETGVAQHYRDIRIAPIYEGTNGIQALDLVLRKLPRGRWRALFAEIRSFAAGRYAPLRSALDALQVATEWLIANPADAAAGATPYLRMFGLVVSGFFIAQQACAAEAALPHANDDRDFLEAKIATAAFYVEQIVPAAHGLLPAVTAPADMLFAITEAQLAA